MFRVVVPCCCASHPILGHSKQVNGLPRLCSCHQPPPLLPAPHVHGSQTPSQPVSNPTAVSRMSTAMSIVLGSLS
jgi:hypothetical protein